MKYIARLYSEILNEVRQSKIKEDKIKILRENDCEGLRELFQYTYGTTKNPYKNGVPKYKPDDSPFGYSYTNLSKEMKRLSYFYNTKYQISNEKMRDKKLRNLLELLHFSEASLLENVFSGNLDTYNITKELVLEAFPNLNIGS